MYTEQTAVPVINRIKVYHMVQMTGKIHSNIVDRRLDQTNRFSLVYRKVPSYLVFGLRIYILNIRNPITNIQTHLSVMISLWDTPASNASLDCPLLINDGRKVGLVLWQRNYNEHSR